MTAKIKQTKKCKVCSKIIRDWNKSGLCGHHYKLKYFRELRKKRKKLNICIQCKKKIEPFIIYPAGSTVPPIIKYLNRCYICQQKQNKWQRDWHREQKKLQKDSVVTTL